MRKLLIILTAIVALFALGACGGSNEPQPPMPDSSAIDVDPVPTEAEPTEVYPERGYVAYVVEAPGGGFACDESIVASTELIVDGGVSANGTIVTTEQVDDGLIVSFGGGAAPFVTGIVNDTIGITIPEGLTGGDVKTLKLAEANFGGAFSNVVLCGGGM